MARFAGGVRHCVPAVPALDALPRYRGRFTARLHVNINAHGFPLGLPITPGETHDAQLAANLTESVSEPLLARLGKKGYGTDDIRSADWPRGMMPMIPTTSNRKVRITVDHALYSLRNRITRYFNKIKNARRVAARYDKLAASFLGCVAITSLRDWLSFVNTTRCILGTRTQAGGCMPGPNAKERLQ